MRLLYILVLISCFSFSQTNEVLVNQAVKDAESLNITTPAQAAQALEASGMTETQARQLAAQRGLSYDQLLNDFFFNENSENPDSKENEDSEEDEDDEDDEDQIEEDEDNQEDNSSDSQDAGRKKDIPLITDFKSKEHKIISCIDRITRPVLTKYEKTLILGQRAQQILKGSNILVNIENLKNRNPLEIARFELSKGVIPFIIRRPLPNGQYEDWKVNELKDINN